MDFRIMLKWIEIIIKKHICSYIFGLSYALSSSQDALLKLSKTISPAKLFPFDYIALHKVLSIRTRFRHCPHRVVSTCTCLFKHEIMPYLFPKYRDMEKSVHCPVLHFVPDVVFFVAPLPHSLPDREDFKKSSWYTVWCNWMGTVLAQMSS